MNEDLVKKFLPRFVETSLGRVGRARELLRADFAGNASAIAAELHTLAGDASVIGLRDLAEQVRELESEVLQGQQSSQGCERSLAALADDIQRLTSE